MAQWARLQMNGEVRGIYGSHFPLELRHYFAPWIESKNWAEIDASVPDNVGVANALVSELLALIQQRVSHLASGLGDTFLLRLHLEDLATNFVQPFLGDPLSFVRVVSLCLQREAELLARFEASQVHDKVAAIESNIQQLHWYTQESHEGLSQTQQLQEAIVIQYQDMCRLEQVAQQMRSANQANQAQFQEIVKQQKAMEAQLAEEAQDLTQRRQVLFDKYTQYMKLIATVQVTVLHEHLREWHDEQRRCYFESERGTDAKLNQIQGWAEQIADLLWKIRLQVRECHMLQTHLPLDMHGGSLFKDLLPKLDALIAELIHNTFVIDKQPPYVLKTLTKLTASVRFLVGGKLNVHMNMPEVSVNIVSQEQARNVMASCRAAAAGLDASPIPHTVCGEILNNRKAMSYTHEDNVMQASFKNMSLKKIKRSGSKVEQVTEEKFALVFSTSFNIGGEDRVYTVQAMSLPVVVVVHGNQVCSAEATILWDYAFGQPDRIPFVVPMSVPWGQLGIVLSEYFRMANHTPLTPDHLQLLAQRVLQSEDVSDESIVSWPTFSKEQLPGRQFSFWDWFYECVEIIHKHLDGPWADGSILGFCTKARAHELLHGKAPGTFILRFSDSELGGITVAWVGVDDTGKPQVWHLQPWFAKDFMIRSLADRIHDLPQLQICYPDKPKDAIFDKYYSEVQASGAPGHDYVQSGIAAVIPAQAVPASMEVAGATPPQFGVRKTSSSEFYVKEKDVQLLSCLNSVV